MHHYYLVTPVRNAVRTIDKTIWSVVSQIGDIHIHYHVQDGQSNDGTVEKIERWAQRLQHLKNYLPAQVSFSFATEADSGMYDAICRGYARMDIPPDSFMGWCNADDALWPDALHAIGKLGKDLPALEWILGWPSWFDDTGRFTAIDRAPRFPHSILVSGLADGVHWPFVQQESTLWRKRLWDRTGGLNPKLRLAGDWDLWLRFSRTATLVHVHRQLGAFHVRPGQQSEHLEAYWSEMNQIFPLEQRQQHFLGSLHNMRDLLTVPIALEGQDNVWWQGERTCGRRAALLTQFIRRFPVSLARTTKLVYELW
jgi:hypothetical protein